MLKEVQPHGAGVFVQVNGDVYDGQWKDGMPDGQGILTHSDNSTKEGDWRHGEFVQ